MELKEEYHPDGKDFEIICIGGMGGMVFFFQLHNRFQDGSIITSNQATV